MLIKRSVEILTLRLEKSLILEQSAAFPEVQISSPNTQVKKLTRAPAHSCQTLKHTFIYINKNEIKKNKSKAGILAYSPKLSTLETDAGGAPI